MNPRLTLRFSRRISTLLLAGAFFVELIQGQSACASEPQVRPTAFDPANANADESHPIRLTPLASSSVSNSTTEKTPKVGTEKTPAPNVIYTCPMHPEVLSDKPGRCPKCGMKLVPKESEAPSDKK